MPVELVVYSRYGCHLCDDMLQTLREFEQDLGLSIAVVDIDDNAALAKQYNDAVPVLTCRGNEICRHFLDLVALEKIVDQERRVS